MVRDVKNWFPSNRLSIKYVRKYIITTGAWDKWGSGLQRDNCSRFHERSLMDRSEIAGNWPFENNTALCFSFFYIKMGYPTIFLLSLSETIIPGGILWAFSPGRYIEPPDCSIRISRGDIACSISGYFFLFGLSQHCFGQWRHAKTKNKRKRGRNFWDVPFKEVP